jgi:hypothetical protein
VVYLGAAQSEYVRLVGRFFLLNMIARVMEPGCIMRAVPVLEGKQERGKSTALAVLGGEWFSDTPFRVGESDACRRLQGVWVYEIGEMQQFGRAEAAAVKQFVSSRVDHYRPPYGRRTSTCRARPCSPARSTRRTTCATGPGNTRFHPITCVEHHEIDVDGLRRDRDQLLAEAFVLYRRARGAIPRARRRRRSSRPSRKRACRSRRGRGSSSTSSSAPRTRRSTVHQVLVEIVKVDPARITDKMMANVGRILTRCRLQSRSGVRAGMVMTTFRSSPAVRVARIPDAVPDSTRFPSGTCRRVRVVRVFEPRTRTHARTAHMQAGAWARSRASRALPGPVFYKGGGNREGQDARRVRLHRRSAP